MSEWVNTANSSRDDDDRDSSPFSQCSPVKPSPHVQFPETESHTPPLLQLQHWEQATPYRSEAQPEHTHIQCILMLTSGKLLLLGLVFTPSNQAVTMRTFIHTIGPNFIKSTELKNHLAFTQNVFWTLFSVPYSKLWHYLVYIITVCCPTFHTHTNYTPVLAWPALTHTRNSSVLNFWPKTSKGLICVFCFVVFGGGAKNSSDFHQIHVSTVKTNTGAHLVSSCHAPEPRSEPLLSIILHSNYTGLGCTNLLKLGQKHQNYHKKAL